MKDKQNQPEELDQKSTQSTVAPGQQKPKTLRSWLIAAILIAALIILLVVIYYLLVFTKAKPEVVTSRQSNAAKIIAVSNLSTNKSTNSKVVNWQATDTNSKIMAYKDGRAYIYTNNTLEPLSPEGYTVVENMYSKVPKVFLILKKNNQLFSYDIVNKTINNLNITLTNSGNIEEKAAIKFESINSNEVLFDIGTYDKNSKEYQHSTDFGGDNPQPIKSQEYRYTYSTNKIVKSNLYSTAKQLIEDNGGSFSEFGGVYIAYWDSSNNIMYGYPTGEGIGRSTPIYKVNLGNKSVTLFKEKGNPYFSPSTKKLILVDYSYKKTDPISASVKVYSTKDFSQLGDPYILTNYNISGLNWSIDENSLIITMRYPSSFYSLNLNTRKFSLVYTDKTKESSYTYFDPNSPALILPSGDDFVYIDWDNTWDGQDVEKHPELNEYHLTKVNISTGQATPLYSSRDFMEVPTLVITSK